MLDLMLPDGDGLALCRGLRAEADPALAEIGLVMLTARGDETDRVVGLEVGADDYVAKGFTGVRSERARAGGRDVLGLFATR